MMRTLLVFVCLCLAGAGAHAAEITGSFTPETRYAFVDGSIDDFNAHHWMNEGWDMGVRDFHFQSEDIGNGFALWNDGRLLPGNADYLYEIEVKKEDVGYVDFEFEQFRKYYDNAGGVNPAFTRLRYNDSGRELYVDMGKLALEVGLTPKDFPDIAFLYEYEYKKGTKSRLTWTNVTDGTLSAKVGPSWQEVDEQVHVFELKIHDDWDGLEWNADQKWERFTNNTKRYERDFSTNATASQNKVREHFLKPRSDMFASVLEAHKWFLKDKVRAGGGYRYSQIENSEVENIIEQNTNGVPTNFSNLHSAVNSPSTNQYQAHTGVADLFWVLSDALNVGIKGKFETIMRESFSVLYQDKSPSSGGGSVPDGVIDQTDFSNTSADLQRWGEAVTLRYSGIPQMVWYNDIEFEQTRNNLIEDRASGSAGELFSRQTINHFYRGAEVAGFNWFPNPKFLINAHYRYVKDNLDYDDLRETDPTTSGAKSAFVDGQSGQTHEITARTTVRLCSWFQPTFRYQYKDHGYTMRFEGNPLDIRSDSISHVYTADLPVQVTPEFLLTGSYQFQDVWTETPANEQTPSNYPMYHGDVGAWLVQADYQLTKDVLVSGTALYQRSENVISPNGFGSPYYSSDFDKIDLTVGVKWKIDKHVTLEPSYSFFYYEPNENLEFGDYRANVAWLGVTFDWV